MPVLPEAVVGTEWCILQHGSREVIVMGFPGSWVLGRSRNRAGSYQVDQDNQGWVSDLARTDLPERADPALLALRATGTPARPSWGPDLRVLGTLFGHLIGADSNSEDLAGSGLTKKLHYS